MFARPLRLREKKVFDILFRRGEWARGRYFSVVYLPAKSRGKIGFIVTKKIAKSSVIRNRNKRRLRAAFEQVLKSSEVLNNYTVVVVIHRTNDELSFESLTKDVQHVLNKIPNQK